MVSVVLLVDVILVKEQHRFRPRKQVKTASMLSKKVDVVVSFLRITGLELGIAAASEQMKMSANQESASTVPSSLVYVIS